MRMRILMRKPCQSSEAEREWNKLNYRFYSSTIATGNILFRKHLRQAIEKANDRKITVLCVTPATTYDLKANGCTNLCNRGENPNFQEIRVTSSERSVDSEYANEELEAVEAELQSKGIRRIIISGGYILREIQAYTDYFLNSKQNFQVLIDPSLITGICEEFIFNSFGPFSRSKEHRLKKETRYHRAIEFDTFEYHYMIKGINEGLLKNFSILCSPSRNSTTEKRTDFDDGSGGAAGAAASCLFSQ